MKKNRAFLVSGFAVLGIFLVIQFQNCGGYNGGLNIDNSEKPLTQCTGGFCGGYLDFVYWNGCEAHALGWAWSDSPAQQKTVMGNFSNNSVCTTTTSLPRPDVRTANPAITSDYSGFDCKLNSNSYTNASLSLNSLTVLGANTKVYNIPITSGVGSTVVPSACGGGGNPFTGACSSNTLAGFGYIDSVSFDGSCNMTIQGWAWSNQSTTSTQVKFLFSDGTSSILFTVKDVRNDVKNIFSCVTGNSGFSQTISTKRFPASALVNNKVTVTPLVYSSAGVQALNPVMQDVGNCKN